MFDLEFLSVSKRYRIASEADYAPRGVFGKLTRLWRPDAEFWALHEVSFGVSRGEALGIIGHNSAGKSTALKLISNITTPTRGEIHIRGRIAALLEVGSGFHPELTGRENVFLSGSILGMRRREIAAKLDSILHFAGVREFADVPVKRYSSGMYVRLGFAIAAHLDADILLLDEVLAVGDTKFQERCQRRILELKATGKTIVFISHDLAAVRALCDSVILLNHGRLIAEGSPSEVIAEYAKLGSERPKEQRECGLGPKKAAHVTSFSFLDEYGEPTTKLRTGFPVRAVLEYEVAQPLSRATINLLFYWSGDWKIASHFSTAALKLTPGTSAIEFSCDELTLGPGAYAASCTIEDENREIDFVSKTYFSVAPGLPLRGGFFSPHRWKQVISEGDADRSKPRLVHDAGA
jgi:ABC-type polysaccharide/polyol phosphate transport system ATPase subunit